MSRLKKDKINIQNEIEKLESKVKNSASKSPELTGLIEGACVDYSSSCFGFYVGYSDSTKLYSFSPLSWE